MSDQKPAEKERQTTRTQDAAQQRAAFDPAQAAPTSPAAQAAHPVLHLQQRVGNAQVARAFSRARASARSGETGAWPEVGRMGGPISRGLAGRIIQSLGRGTALDGARQAVLEETFGVPLDDVRLHTDEEARDLSINLSARAFTLGSDIYFGPDAGPADTHLLRHEIAHVVQQRVSAPAYGPLTVGPADDALESAAETAAREPGARGQAAEPATPGAVQRDFWDEMSVGNLSGIIGTGASILQGAGEMANAPLAAAMGTSPAAITDAIPGGTALGGITSVLGLVTGTQDMLNEDKPWYERVVGGMSAIGGATGTASTISSMFGSSLFAAGGSAGLTAGAGSALTGGGAGLLSGAGAATALGSLGAVLGAGAAGYGAGRLLDEGVGSLGQMITGDEQGDYTISGGLAGLMTSADQSLTSLWADPDRPAYTQTIGWQLGELLGI